MRRSVFPTRHAKLIGDLTNAAVDMQALSNRLANMEGLPVAVRSHAFRLGEAARSACAAAVAANGGHHTDDLLLYFGEWLTTSARKRDALNPLEETGLFNKFKSERPEQTRESLAVRRARLNSGEPVPSPS